MKLDAGALVKPTLGVLGGDVSERQRVRRQARLGKDRKGPKWRRTALVEAGQAAARTKETTFPLSTEASRVGATRRRPPSPWLTLSSSSCTTSSNVPGTGAGLPAAAPLHRRLQAAPGSPAGAPQGHARAARTDCPGVRLRQVFSPQLEGLTRICPMHTLDVTVSTCCEVFFVRPQGLGNRLFPWARCRIFSWANHVPMLAPHWCLLRIGPLKRRQVRVRDFLRQSMLCGQFTPTPDMVAGRRRVAIRRRATIVPEPHNLDTFDSESLGPGDHVVRFRGIRRGFAPLQGWNGRLRSELLRSIKPRQRQLADRTANSVIGVHVRRGDFFEVSGAELASSEGPRAVLRTPTQWFVKSVAVVRELLGWAAPVFVVSDAAPHELDPLLALDDVTLLRGGSPISDMLALCNAEILLGSVGSSFTAWATFLGQMTTCTFPAPGEERFSFVNRAGHYAGWLDPEAPAEDLINDVRRLRR